MIIKKFYLYELIRKSIKYLRGSNIYILFIDTYPQALIFAENWNFLRKFVFPSF